MEIALKALCTGVLFFCFSLFAFGILKGSGVNFNIIRIISLLWWLSVAAIIGSILWLIWV